MQSRADFLCRFPPLLVAFCALVSCQSAPDAGRGSSEDEHRTIAILGSELSGGFFRPAKIVIDYEEGLRTGDQRLRVMTNIRNRTYSQIEIQVQTVFKDAEWNPVDEKVDWRLLRLGPRETRRYEATSESPDPERYTVRIRPFQ